MTTLVPVLNATAWIPRKDQVIVRQLEAATRTAGGLHVPEQHRDKPQQGLVIAVGPDVPYGIAAGDVVAFGKFAGLPFDDPLSGLSLLVMREVECILHRPAATVTLIEHATSAGRRVVHEAGVACEWCPTPELDALRAAFRRRHADVSPEDVL